MRPSFALAASLVTSAACTTPDRAFAPDDTTATSSGSSTATTSTGVGPGTGGSGDGGDASSPSSSSQGGGDPEDCGNGVRDPGEDCDEDTELCDACSLACPSGWFSLGDSCFAVALNDVQQYDAFTADAKCGALEVGATGHRAHAATPSSLDELASLATRCPNNGCWLGFYAFGPPGERAFTAAATGDALLAEPPWAEGAPGDALCLKLLLTEDGGPELADQPCDALGYFACELDPAFGDVTTCGDGSLDDAEECDGDPACVDCDRRCPAEWSEDPRTHACLRTAGSTTGWNEAALLCEEMEGRLATPDEVADVRVASAITSNAWLGLQALDEATLAPTWISGEAFVYEPGVYPLPSAPGAVSNAVLLDGEIFFEVPPTDHDALCEQLDPDG